MDYSELFPASASGCCKSGACMSKEHGCAHIIQAAALCGPLAHDSPKVAAHREILFFRACVSCPKRQS